MTPLALVLVIVAGAFHVVWNYLAKSSEDKIAFLWIINGVFFVTYLPVFFLLGYSLHLPGRGWLMAGLSGLIHAGYFWTLGRAYEGGDLSLVYPLSRGSSVFLVGVLSVPLLGERLSAPGVAGVVTVLLGIFILHMRPGSWKQSLLPSRTPGAWWALITGLTITGFSLVDKTGVGILDPVVYMYLVFFFTLIFFTPLALKNGIVPIRTVWRRQSGRLFLLGLLMPAAYGMILFAYTLAPVAYVAAAREVRLLFGTLAGAWMLKEERMGHRLSGAGLIVAGVVLISFAG